MSRLADALLYAFNSTLLIVCGFVAGFHHGTEATGTDATPWFMLGFAAAGGLTVAVLTADRYDLLEVVGA